MHKRPTRPSGLKNVQNCDSVRRFIAAYAAQAVIDYLYPVSRLERKHRRSAAEFIHSEDGQYIIEHFGITPARIRETINRKGKEK